MKQASLKPNPARRPRLGHTFLGGRPAGVQPGGDWSEAQGGRGLRRAGETEPSGFMPSLTTAPFAERESSESECSFMVSAGGNESTRLCRSLFFIFSYSAA